MRLLLKAGGDPNSKTMVVSSNSNDLIVAYTMHMCMYMCMLACTMNKYNE